MPCFLSGTLRHLRHHHHHGRITGINHRHIRLLQRADGYAYTTHKEETFR